MPPAAETVGPSGIACVVVPDRRSLQINVPGCPTAADPSEQT